jgi:hypothetical protein
MAKKVKEDVGMTDEEWANLKKQRMEEFSKIPRSPVMLRKPGTMKDWFSFTRPKNGKVYQFSKS